MIRTLPELARAWWTFEDRWGDVSGVQQVTRRPLAPAYRVPPHVTGQKRVEFLARMVRLIADRISRLPRVWEEWDVFDPGAFFDLYPEQVDVLIRIAQSRSRVKVTFYTDVLLPGFQDAEQFWMHHVVPALHVAHPVFFGNGHEPPDPAGLAWAEEVARELGPQMEERLYRAAREIRAVRDLLYEWGIVDFLITSASWEERYRVARSRNGHVDPSIWKRVRFVPTLTLEVAFSLVPPEEKTRRRALMRWQHRPWRRSHAK